MFAMVLLSIILPVILIILNSFISMKKQAEREKGSPFECGYDPKSEARVPFSLHFFLIAVIFLIFDVEITMIMPMPVILGSMEMKTWTIISTFFITILIGGAAHEWNEGSLEWSK